MGTATLHKNLRRAIVRSTFFRASLIAAALFLAAPITAFADNSAVWLAPGGGVYWPPWEWGVDKATHTYGGILGFRVSPALALEIRGHSSTPDSANTFGVDTKLFHAEGNATWFVAHESDVTPYVTAGLGAIRADRSSVQDGTFAWNAGAGIRWSIGAKMSIRVDARDISYELVHPVYGGESFRHSFDLFGGLSFGFGGEPSDKDSDGVSNKQDQCPWTPLGARVDVAGCPIDGDGDGVFDGIDKCDRTPAGATVDVLGCPTDTDKDGFVDGIDDCQETPAGARVDGTGCPLDSDGDGVYDGLDRCEGTPSGCTVNPNGCPADADQDGICDGVDQCPDTPASARVDAMGCPIQVSVRDTELLETGLIRIQNINFDTGSSLIKDESYEVLDEVGSILVRWPQLRIEIGGHADSEGGAAANRRLSEARAKAVLDYLMSAYPELNPEQFTAVGYGEARPVTSNSNSLGRAKNRRVEFKVLNKEALKRETEKWHFAPKE